MIGIDPIPFRREHAQRIGAADTIDPTACEVAATLRDATKGVGVDMALECSGTATALEQALDTVRRKGAVSIVGENSEEKIRPSNHFNRKEVTLCGSTCFPLGGRTGTNGEIDFSDAAGVTLMEREHRDHIYRYARFMRQYVPGFENAYLLIVAPYLNARGGRYMAGIRPVTFEDLAAERRFDDVPYIYDDRRSQKNCEVPYRSFVAAKVDGLLAAGRASHVYGPNFRGRCWALQNGQAMGIAAALCARSGLGPRDLDVRELQRELVRLGCPVGDDARLRDLSLA